MLHRCLLRIAAASLLLVAHAALADVFTNVPEAAGYQLVQTLTIPVAQGACNVNAIPYAVNNAASFPAGTFTRVAYYLELSGSTDPSRPNGYVYVSFDRPTAFPSGASLGVPSNGPNGSRVVTNTTVSNLNVVSNVQGVITGTGLPGGKLEFWPSGYGTGANGVFDYDDDSFDNTNGYGSMQIHNVAAGQTLLAYNHWGASGEVGDVGLGTNRGTGSPDWTFSGSASAYTVRTLQVLVKPAVLVSVVNPSFELDAIAGPNAPVFEIRGSAPSGWQFTDNSGARGLLAPDVSEPNNFYAGATPGFQGGNIYFIGNGSGGLSQTLAETVRANTTYTLRVASGTRTTGERFGGYGLQLKTPSGALVGSWTGVNRNVAPPGSFADTARTFTTGPNPPGLGEPLVITLGQAPGGGYTDLDNARLSADPAPARNAALTPMDVLLVAGQSNAHGWRANVNTLSSVNRRYADAPDPRVLLAYRQRNLPDPLDNVGSVGQLAPQGAGFEGNFTGFGPELALGSDVAGRSGRGAAILKYAIGGAGLQANFRKTLPTDANAAYHLYPLLIGSINEQLQQLRDQGYDPRLKALFWLQGESDTGPEAAGSYGANITQFISDLRGDLSAPQLQVYLTEINGNMPAFQSTQAAAGVMQVNAGMRAADAADANVFFIPTSDIATGFADEIHYSADQTIAIGQRWAAAYAPATAATRVPEITQEGYQVLYELNIPLDAGYRDTVQVPYTVDNSLTTPVFDRVAYYLELTNPDSSTRWVYASMDAFTNVAKQLGLPHNVLNPVKFQQIVQNLNVFSNAPDIVTGTSLDGGVVEMWPSSYNSTRETFFYAGSGVTLDWSDGGGTASDAGYGSFQVHNPLARQVVFAYNHWGASGGGNDDIGIGSRPTGDPDYSFAANAGAYTARKLVILVRPGMHVTFSAAPKNHALIPRDLATNRATVPFAGSETEGGYANAILRVYRSGVFQGETVQALAYTGTSAPFSFNPQIPAELAGYDFEVLIEKAGQRRLVRRVTDVVAGDAYLFYGQSNTEAGGTFANNNTSSNGYAGPWVRTFGQNADSGVATRNNLSWVPANGDGAGSTFIDPGAVGQWAIVVGGKIVADHHVPVAILNGARGGYSMPQLQKDDAMPDNLDDSGTTTRTYNRLRYRALQSGVAAKARAMFYYQGESEIGNAQAHADGFAGLYADWQTDYPGLEHIYEVQVRPGCGVEASNVALRQTQRGFGDLYPRTSVMATNGLDAHDGCHYQFISGYETLGLNHFRQVSRDLYGGPAGPNIDALNPARVFFPDDSHTQIRVVTRDPGATITFPAAAIADFALTGTAAQIIGASASGNTFTLLLDSPANGNPVLEYRSHLGSGAWVTNANGVGLLSFAEAVGPFGPLVTITAPTASQEASVGATINITATAANGPNGPATRLVLLINGVPQLETGGNSLNTTWQVPAKGAYRISVVAYDASENFGSDSFSVLAGASAVPGTATGLRLWFKAETGVTQDANGRVSAWQDQSGNNFHATQGGAGAQPRFQDNAFGIGAGLQFDGTNHLDSAAGMPTGSYTKIIRFKALAAGQGNNLMSSNADGTASARAHAFFAPGLVPTIFHSGSTLASDQPVASGSRVIAACTFDAASNEAKIYVDGVLRSTGTLAGPNSVAAFQLGAYVGGNALQGGLAEVIVYDHVLTDAERAAVFDYLDDRYRTPYGLYLKRYYGPGGDANADTDRDGLSTVVEYALGLDPTVADSASTRLPQVALVNGNVEVTYRRAADHPDVITQLESSPDLQTWTPVSESSLGVSGNLETRRHTATVTPGIPRLFYRLRVTLPQP